MSDLIKNHPAGRRSPANESGEGLREFLVRKLPRDKAQRAPDVANALREAGARFDRYAATKKEWLNYPTRRRRLKKISELAARLASELGDLDILSRDDLTTRLGPKQIETFIGLLHFLNKETTDLTRAVQKDGRPRDLAEERLVLEVADIYENAFGQPARVWGSDSRATQQHGTFYRVLELSPTSFLRYGKLSLRQINRVLKNRDTQRRHSKGIFISLEEAVQYFRTSVDDHKK